MQLMRLTRKMPLSIDSERTSSSLTSLSASLRDNFDIQASKTVTKTNPAWDPAESVSLTRRLDCIARADAEVSK